MKVLIIIPAYNEEKCIRPAYNAIYSLLAQNNIDCEFIFVDDYSSDDTVEKFSSLTQNDSRFTILKQEKRSDPFQARKRGVGAAVGKYIMFLDADDTFIPKACETAYRTIVNKDADLVLFGSKPVKTGNISQKVLNEYARYLRFEDKIRGIYSTKQECHALYFKEAGFGFATSLAKKIFKANTLKQVMGELNSELYLGYGQDLYQLIATMSKTNSLYANNQLILHNYFIGDGVTQLGQASISIEKYKRIVSSANTYKAIEAFVLSSSLGEEEKTNALKCAKKGLLASAQKHLWQLSDDCLAEGITMLRNAWGNDYLNELPLANNLSRIEKFILGSSSTPEDIKRDIRKALPSITSATIDQLTKEVDTYKNSASYKIGYIITTPIRWLARIFS